MKATGLEVNKNILSSINGKMDNFINTNYQCKNIEIEDYTWESPNQNFSSQPEIILDQFEKNGKVNILNKFKNKCLQDSKESALNRCKNKKDMDLDCYYYSIDGKIYQGDIDNQDKIPNDLSNAMNDSIKSTVKSLQDQCDRDNRNNQPELCNETVVMGLDKSNDKVYAFQSSNKCYLDYLNGSQYDYLKINNMN
tara:strand:- start:435 stop:1019 length:585 start_codon:yes stop_codon:yes gene_type:complete